MVFVIPIVVFGFALALASPDAAAATDAFGKLRLGRACHAFEHLGELGHQAEAAVASGATVIYTTGLGGEGYSGLPGPEVLAARRWTETEYTRSAKAKGVRLALGYVCATSIVGLDSFDRNWTAEFRAQF